MPGRRLVPLALAALLVPVLSAAAPDPLAPPAAPEGAQLVRFFEAESLAFRHARYAQVVDGLPVLDAGADVHVGTRDPALRASFAHLVPAQPRSGALVVAPEAARAAAEGAVPGGEAFAASGAWLPTDAGLRAVWAVDVRAPDGERRVLVDGERGAVLEVRATSLDFEAPGRVFGDNPIVALRDGAFRDNAAAVDTPAFAGAYRDVVVPNIVFGLGGFKSPRLIVADALQWVRPGDDLRFSRSDPRFLEVSAYFWLEDALGQMAAVGYPDLVPERIDVFAHRVDPVAVALAPNAYATTSWDLVFFYRGGGRGSSAEDAEVVVHELGHLFHFAAAPGLSGSAVGWFYEGTADLYAALLLEPHTGGFGDACTAEWLTTYFEESPVVEALVGDGLVMYHEGLPCLRVLDHDLVWPDDRFVTGDPVHQNGMFWAGPMWEIRQEIGREEALVLTTEALYLMPTRLGSFEDMARAVLLADEGLTGGAHEQVIRDAFGRHGIAP